MSTATMSYNFSDLLLNLYLLPTRIEMKRLTRKEKRKDVQNQKLILKKASDSSVSKSDWIDKEMEDKINALPYNAVELLQLHSTAEMTMKYINYVIWYISDPTALRLEGIDKQTQEFCNSLSLFYGFGKIYESADSADLKLYNIDQPTLVRHPKFCLSMTKILTFNSDQLKEKIQERKKALELDTDVRAGFNALDPDAIVPIRFSAPNESNTLVQAYDGTVIPDDKKGNLSDDKYYLCEKFINPLMTEAGIKYAYSLTDTGLIALSFIKNNYPYQYFIDPGSTLGKDQYCFIVRLQSSISGATSTEVIALSDTDLVKKLLINDFENPSVEEAQDHESDKLLSTSVAICNTYDFSDLDISTITEDDKKDLETALLKIYTAIDWLFNIQNTSTDRVPVPRMRFTEYGDANTFNLVSDNNCINVFVYAARTGLDVYAGFKVELIAGKCKLINPEGILIYEFNLEEVNINQ